MIASKAALYFNHVGAEVAEKHGAVGSSEGFCQLDDADGFKHAAHSAILSFITRGRLRPAALLNALKMTGNSRDFLRICTLRLKRFFKFLYSGGYS